MSKPAPYHLLDIAGKQALQRERAREPAVTCPACDTHVMVDDLLKHILEGMPVGLFRNNGERSVM